MSTQPTCRLFPRSHSRWQAGQRQTGERCSAGREHASALAPDGGPAPLATSSLNPMPFPLTWMPRFWAAS